MFFHRLQNFQNEFGYLLYKNLFTINLTHYYEILIKRIIFHIQFFYRGKENLFI